MRLRTTIVCGLVDSGKTNFIENSVQHSDEKTVILVNDFGQADIDGELFSAGGIDTGELPSGCVSCTLKRELLTAVMRIITRFAPERLIDEPSGVASPSGVIDALAGAGLGPVSVVGIVDATEFVELYDSGIYGSFFEDQIKHSDVIVVNKTDLVDQMRIAVIERMISAINPRAIIYRSVNASSNVLLPDAPEKGTIVPGACHFHFETLSFKPTQGLELLALRKLFDDLSQGTFGRVARAKALIDTSHGPYRFDSTFSKVDVVPFESAIEEGRLVVIGENLDGDGIGQAIQCGLRT